MPIVSREFETKEEAKKWIEEVKVTDDVKSERIEKSVTAKWKAIVEVK